MYVTRKKELKRLREGGKRGNWHMGYSYLRNSLRYKSKASSSIVALMNSGCNTSYKEAYHLRDNIFLGNVVPVEILVKVKET